MSTFIQTVYNFRQKTAVREFLAEFIGTFILIGVGDAASASFTFNSRKNPADPFGVSFCWGLGAMIAIIATGPVSGEP